MFLFVKTCVRLEAYPPPLWRVTPAATTALFTITSQEVTSLLAPTASPSPESVHAVDKAVGPAPITHVVVPHAKPSVELSEYIVTDIALVEELGGDWSASF